MSNAFRRFLALASELQQATLTFTFEMVEHEAEPSPQAASRLRQARRLIRKKFDAFAALMEEMEHEAHAPHQG